MKLAKDIQKYIQQVELYSSEEINELFDKVQSSYFESLSLQSKLKRVYFIILFLFILVKSLGIKEIEIAGITIKEYSTFSSLFLVACSYSYFRLWTQGTHKMLLEELYFRLRAKSSKLYLKYDYDLFLYPNSELYTEHILKEKFNVNNRFAVFLSFFHKLFLFASLIIVWWIFIFELRQINLKEVSSYDLAINITAFATSVLLIISAISTVINGFSIQKK